MQRPYSAKEVAELTARSTDTIYRWVRQGCIPYRRLQETSLIFPRAEIDAWLEGKPGCVVAKQEGEE
jgi:excisionase family DNA binding protein